MAISRPNGRLTYEVKLKVNGRRERFPAVRDKTTSRAIEARIAKLISGSMHHQPVPPEIISWLRDLPSKSPRLYRRLVECRLADPGLIGRRKLIDLLYGTIVRKDGFDEQAAKYHRNGNTLEQAQRKVRAHHPTLFKCEPNQGGYFQSLLADGNTPEHVLQQTRRVEVALAGCNATFWEDLDGEQLKQWLHEQRSTRKDFGAAT
jgi:hypothetical protein